MMILASSFSRAADSVVSPPGTPALSGLLPSTIQLSPDLRAAFAEMLQSSPTFRQQIERIIAAPRLVITAQIDPKLVERSYRARSSIRRYNTGLIVVAMAFGPGRRQAEWIAHEFEHVIEQLDGVRVSGMAKRGERGAWFSSEQMIETARACQVGRTVLAEVSARHGDQTSLWSRLAQ